MTEALITVITPTHGRTEEVIEAVSSVAEQTYGVVEHLVLGDDCPALADRPTRRRIERSGPRVTVLNVPSAHGASSYRPARTARIRNAGLFLASGRFVAHLDDDNTYEPDHLATLMEVLKATPLAVAAHSWRRLVRTNGSPYRAHGLNPWIADPASSAQNYRALAESGVFEDESDIVRDRLYGRDGQPLLLVDTSELLVDGSFHRRVPFPTSYSPSDEEMGVCEDRAWIIAALAAGAHIVCSRRATLLYRLGGYSNAITDDDGIRLDR